MIDRARESRNPKKVIRVTLMESYGEIGRVPVNLLWIVLVCSASVILTSQKKKKKHSIEFHFWQGRKGQQSIAVKGFYDNYLSYCTMQS